MPETDIRLMTEVGGFAIVIAGIVWNAATMVAGFKNHGKELVDMRKDVDKIEETLTIVAVQKDQIQSIRETQITNMKRTDETFTRVFAILDRLQASGTATR